MHQPFAPRFDELGPKPEEDAKLTKPAFVATGSQHLWAAVDVSIPEADPDVFIGAVVSCNVEQ
jgi:hypothetical protein